MYNISIDVPKFIQMHIITKSSSGGMLPTKNEQQTSQTINSSEIRRRIKKDC